MICLDDLMGFLSFLLFCLSVCAFFYHQFSSECVFISYLKHTLWGALNAMSTQTPTDKNTVKIYMLKYCSSGPMNVGTTFLRGRWENNERSQRFFERETCWATNSTIC